MPLFESVYTQQYRHDDDILRNREDDTNKYEFSYNRRESSTTSGSQIDEAENFIVGDRVLINGSKAGVIAFIGETQFGSGDWAGVVLDEPTGKNNGTVSGVRYFQCPPNKGIFCRLSRLSRYPGSAAHDFHSFRNSRPSTPDRKTTFSSTIRARTPTVYTSISGRAGNHNISLGDRVIVQSSYGSKAGTLRYIGTTEFETGVWCGVELDDPSGKNDGSVNGIKYFACASKCGLFVPAEKVSRSPISNKKSAPCVIHPDRNIVNSRVRLVKVYYPDWESEYY